MNPITVKLLVFLFILWIVALGAEVILPWLQQHQENRLAKLKHSPGRRTALTVTIEIEDLNR